MTGRAWLAMLVFVLPAVLPVLAATGLRPESNALLFPVGALIAGVAATMAVVTHSALTTWWVVVIAISDAAAIAVLYRRTRRARRMVVFERQPLVWLPFLVATSVCAVGLATLRNFYLSWDAQSFWLLHARLLTAGGDTYAHAMNDPAYQFSKVDYPMLVPGSVASGWKVIGSFDYRFAQVLISLIGASLLVLGACLVARAIPRAVRAWVGSVTAGVFVLAAFGFAGFAVTNGYADVVAAAAATAAMVALLVLPRSRFTLSIGVATALITGLTKNEGIVACLMIALLFALRTLLEYRNVSRFAVLLQSSLLGAAVLVWPLTVRAIGTSGTFLGGQGGIHTPQPTRAHTAITTLAHHMSVTVLVVVLGVVIASTALWRTQRSQLRLGHSAWTWLMFVGVVTALVVTYTRGPYNIDWWLTRSVWRVTVLPLMIIVVELSIWVGIAIAELRRDRQVRSVPSGQSAVVPQPAGMPT